jgi:hypothetical protein
MSKPWKESKINPLTPELNPSTRRCLPRFLIEILIFKGLNARSLYMLFGVKGLKLYNNKIISGTAMYL